LSEAEAGWVTETVLKGAPVKKDMLGSPAEAGQTTFYTRSFPVVDPSTEAVTDDETKVTVYVDDVAQDPGAFTLTGAEGKVVFTAAPGADKVVTISYTWLYTIAWGYSTEVQMDPGNKPLHVQGQRTPKKILDGKVRITGTMERYMPDRDWMTKVGPPDAAGKKAQEEKEIRLWPLSNASGKPKLVVTGVKFGPYTLSNKDPGEAITESIKWEGTTATPSVVP